MGDIEAALAKLVGCSMTGIGRAAAMGVLTSSSGGDATYDGEAKRVSTINFHIQCSFRFMCERRILLGADDMSWPEDRAADPSEAMDAFQTMYDRNAKRLESALQATQILVNDWALGEAGAVTLRMTHGISLEIFPAISGRVESWRLFVEGEDHFVYRDR